MHPTSKILGVWIYRNGMNYQGPNYGETKKYKESSYVRLYELRVSKRGSVHLRHRITLYSIYM